MMLWLAGALIVLAGAAIGACSIGGVLVVPALSRFAGLPLPEAVAVSSLAFAVTGLAGRRSVRDAGIDGRTLWPLYCAALLAALAGAALVHVFDPAVTRYWVALLAVASGVYGLIPRSPGAGRPMPATPTLCVIGLAVGFGSALSGTGGPVLLLPLLMLLRVPVTRAVAVSQSVQLPIALAASTGHALNAHLPWALGLAIGVVMLGSATAGRRLASYCSPAMLRLGISLGLVALGFWYVMT
ncbi:hypothetical protein UB46_42425 [Burkholderiaceae bacterium 16]|nr:hypothetical protein UB46_42425 [Burkholderiaceae bacterium 16]